MRCTYCGTELPGGALFCGECGRAVSAAPAAKRVAVPRVAPQPSRRSAVVEAFDPPGEPGSAGVPAERSVVRRQSCGQCGAELAPDDIFCGECGYVSSSASRNFGRPRDTAIIETVSMAEPDALPVAEPDAPPVAEPDAQPEPEPEPGPASAPDAEPQPEYEPLAPPAAQPTPRAEAEPAPFDDGEDVEATRIVSQHSSGARFVLQFSTGESVTVYGNGLIGRNPRAEPAEYFDYLVRVLDPGKSVSKTHLEFGQESGAFWIKDRFSGNGSVVREPDTEPVRCHPDRRYRIVRGTRVDIGEQFFVVS
ncbi:MAG: zinc-ribbon domain-containing protein [Lacisediminihabitans sp.]